MKSDNFERELPAGYELKKHIDAKDKKTTVFYLLLSIVPLIISLAVAVLITVYAREWTAADKQAIEYTSFVLFGVCLILLVYIILHELTHGITYKILTGAKLTFGISWSVAFCGVPEIFVYRKAAKIAVIMPFAIFTVVFTGLTVGAYFINAPCFIAASGILGVHLGGCVGDLHAMYMLNHEFKDDKTLVRDTGPEQFFYVYTGVENDTIKEME